MSARSEALASRVRAAWSADTLADPRWTSSTPSLGQCAVTALVVQDELGGELLRAVVDGVSHYWNRLPDGSELDLTRDQFPVWVRGPTELRSRVYVLSYPDTRKRYDRLCARLRAEP